MNQLVIAPLLIPLVGGILLLLTRGGLPLNARRSLNLALTGLNLLSVVALLGLVAGGQILSYQLGNWAAPYGISLVADRLSIWMLLITAQLALFALLYAIRDTDRGSRHFHPLFQLQIFGINGAFLTGDLFNLFVFFEVLLLASYGLLLHGGGAARVRAGLHFVVLNLVGSTLFLFAVGTLYALLGTLNMADMALRITQVPPEDLGVVRVAGLLLFGVFALKAALLPLYLWLPAAYSSTSAPVAALFAIMTKIGAYAILRVETLIFGDQAGALSGLIAPLLLPLALLTLGIGALGVLASQSLRRQVAYLVVVSVGFLLSAFALGTQEAISAGLYYLPSTSLAAAALFLLADLIARGRGSVEDHLEPAPSIPLAPLVGGVFFFAAILVAGLPPLSGFLGKWMLLDAAMTSPAMPWVLALVLGSGLLAVLSLVRAGSLVFYRATVVEVAPMEATSIASISDLTRQARVDTEIRLAPIVGLLLLALLMVVAAGPATDYTTATAAQLQSPQGYIQAVLGFPESQP